MKKDIRNFTLEELKKEIISLKEPVHRAAQIFQWVNQKGVSSFGSMTNLSREFIKKMEDFFYIGKLACVEEKVSKDGTRKFLWRLDDGGHIETVVIGGDKRTTFCISTQVGCKFKCTFCASGTIKFDRNLSAGEITGQILEIKRKFALTPTNIVFMGIGEPLDNFDNLAKAIRIINDSAGLNVGARKITISTCGIIPGIRKLMNLGLQVELSISLHAANDKLRNELVPANKKYPITQLIEVCAEYHKKTKRIITLEYVLIKDINDSFENAKELAALTKEIKGKINVIEYNPCPKFEYEKPDRNKVFNFIKYLQAKGAIVTLRRSKGIDIMASCGQLAAEKSG